MTQQLYHTDEAKWNALSNNSKSADGRFYYAVITTGIYCRPSCPSRLPNRSNVEYFTSCMEAEAAGYRPCKRCTPRTISGTQERERKVIQACRLIEESETALPLKELARKVGLSPSHFHRLFKKTVGITPKQYSSKHQSFQFQDRLKSSGSVTEAIFAAGYGSCGSAYDKTRDQLAMTPQEYRRGASGISIQYGVTPSTLGWLIVAATDRGICAIEFGDNPDILPEMVQDRFPNAQLRKADEAFHSLLGQVVELIDSPSKSISLPLDIQGTAFQQQVWQLLRQIKPGETLSYSEVAERLGKPKAARSVASACASNKIAVVIPCHRVISKSGKTGGYRWGTDRKQQLLELEKKS